MSSVMDHVGAVVCVKDEEPNLRHLLPTLRDVVGEIVVVDGGSTDGSWELAEGYADQIVRDDGRGKGAAIRLGAETATSPVVVFIDADLSHDPAEIPLLVTSILRGEADMVVGSRSTGGSRELHGTMETFLRATGSHLILLAINKRFGVHLTDSQNGFRAIRRSLLLRCGLEEPHTTIEQEMTIEVLRRGYRVVEVPAHEYARFAGESKISLIRHSLRYVTSLIRLLLRRRKRRSTYDQFDDEGWRQQIEELRQEHGEQLQVLGEEVRLLRDGINPAIKRDAPRAA